MAKQKHIPLFDDQLEVVNFLSDQELGAAVRAAMQFMRDGSECELPGCTGMLYEVLKAQFLRQQKDVENGSTGGRPPKNETNASKTKPPFSDSETPLKKDETTKEKRIEDKITKDNSLVSPDGSTKAKQVFEPDSLPYRAARWLADQIEERLPNCTPHSETTLQSWAADFDKCHRLDGHAWEDINDVLQFSQGDSFWSTNILSAGKFRKQYTQLLAKMGGSP